MINVNILQLLFSPVKWWSVLEDNISHLPPELNDMYYVLCITWGSHTVVT